MRPAGFRPTRCAWASTISSVPRVRRQLAAEIRAQFAAFAATGLTLDHANAHKHMHLHPTVGRLLLQIGAGFGLRSVRVPAEPPAVLARCGTPVGFGAHALYQWTRVLRRQARAAGMITNDYCFGLAWSGHMTAERVRRLLRALPDGDSEIYFHPAVARDAALMRLMPDYEHAAELATLLDLKGRSAILPLPLREGESRTLTLVSGNRPKPGSGPTTGPSSHRRSRGSAARATSATASIRAPRRRR